MIKKIILILILLHVILFNIFTIEIDLDTDGDNKIDRWINAALYKEWKKIDKNQNDIPDESCLYVSDKNIIYFITEEKFDYTKNGKPNIWIKNTLKNKDFHTEIKADENNDGKIDLIVYKTNDIIYLQKSDSDYNGIFEQEEHYSYGQKIKEAIDSNKDGIMDDFYYFNGELLEKEEIDSNFDKKPDLWVIFKYNPDNSLYECIIKKDNNYDGKPDEWHYTDKKRRVIKVEKDTDFDGKVDSVKDLKK